MKGDDTMETGKYELVVVWSTGEKDIFGGYDSKEAAEKCGANMRIALGEQVQWYGARPVFIERRA